MQSILFIHIVKKNTEIKWRLNSVCYFVDSIILERFTVSFIVLSHQDEWRVAMCLSWSDAVESSGWMKSCYVSVVVRRCWVIRMSEELLCVCRGQTLLSHQDEWRVAMCLSWSDAVESSGWVKSCYVSVVVRRCWVIRMNEELLCVCRGQTLLGHQDEWRVAMHWSLQVGTQLLLKICLNNCTHAAKSLVVVPGFTFDLGRPLYGMPSLIWNE
jgi:hypothetical protein